VASEIALPIGESPLAKERSPWGRRLHGVGQFIVRKPLGALGAFIIIVMMVMALIAWTEELEKKTGFGTDLAQKLTGYRYDDQVLRDRHKAPLSSGHVLGTDHVGRDTLSRLVYGSRISITIGFLAVAISQGLAAFVGIISGYYGGRFDFFFQRIVDIWQALPGLVALIFVISLFGSSMMVLVVTIGVLGAPSSSRVVRGTVISVRQNQYVEAAMMLGASNTRIIIRHVLPNIIHIIIISASVGIGAAILVESALAFLGFGLPPPFPTWGRMLNNSREYILNPWLAIWPGLALTLTVFAFNVLGDALRDVWDPRLRGSR
jgi:peptide/nickel transport system permease protein